MIYETTELVDFFRIFINSCRKTHKLACGMNGVRIEREFLEGGSPLIVDRTSPLGLRASCYLRSQKACSVVVLQQNRELTELEINGYINLL